jgi:hypothetical protein
MNCKNKEVKIFVIAKASLVCLVSMTTILISCGGSGSGLKCDSIQSVSGFVQRFTFGLDNFSENQYQQLRLDTLDVLDTVDVAAKESSAPENALGLSSKISLFIQAMDDVSWDVTRALQTTKAIESADELASDTTLRQANDVESFVIRECGLPSTIPVGSEGENRLPDPSIPSPTATDPTTNTINELSETDALGTTVANIFGLTLGAEKVRCLGESLSGVIDLSDGTSNSAQYQGQFQKAFDACGIQFSVPVD